MSQIISLAGMIATLAMLIRLCLDVSRGGILKSESLFGQIKVFVAAMTVLSAVALALSGFGAFLLPGGALGGYLLMGHVSAGGAFMVGLAASAILWSEKCRLCTCGQAGEPSAAGQWTAPRRTLFWCFLIFGFGTALTTLISMVPLFSSHMLHVFVDVHRWCALLVIVSAAGFSFSK